MEYLLSTNNLTKIYGKQRAVDKVNIHIRKGDIYGLIGKNGAGKTTILRMLGGLAKVSEGEYSLYGYTGSDIKKVQSRVGILIEDPGVYPNMSAYENLKIKCIAAGVKDKGIINELLNTVGLGDVGKKKVKNFSLGMKQRLGIALALVGNPDLVILDEPINGLDPQGIAEIRETIEKLNREKGITFIISSHILEELSKMATNYGIIHKGVLVKELTKEQLWENCGEYIEIHTEDVKQACTVIEKLNIKNYKVIDAQTLHVFERLEESADITYALSTNKVRIKEIAVKNVALEDYFLKLTGGEANV